MAMVWYNIKLSNVTLIGDFPYFENTNEIKICSFGFGRYRGIEVKKWYDAYVHNGDCYKNKAEAIDVAKKHYETNRKFADGTIPFEIVFYLRGIGWQVFTSNTVNNDCLVREKLIKKDRKEFQDIL